MSAASSRSARPRERQRSTQIAPSCTLRAGSVLWWLLDAGRQAASGFSAPRSASINRDSVRRKCASARVGHDREQLEVRIGVEHLLLAFDDRLVLHEALDQAVVQRQRDVVGSSHVEVVADSSRRSASCAGLRRHELAVAVLPRALAGCPSRRPCPPARTSSRAGRCPGSSMRPMLRRSTWSCRVRNRPCGGRAAARRSCASARRESRAPAARSPPAW